MAREMPTKQGDMLKDIWGALWGYNGSTGLIARMERVETRLDGLNGAAADAMRKALDEKGRSKHLRRGDWLRNAVSIATLLALLFAALGFRSGWMKAAVQRWIAEPVAVEEARP